MIVANQSSRAALQQTKNRAALLDATLAPHSRTDVMTSWNPDSEGLSTLGLKKIPLSELLRLRSKRWRRGEEGLRERVEEELKRRDPRNDWACRRCDHKIFHEKQIRVSGGLASSWFGVETEKFHAVVCDYCGHTEFYSVLMDASSKTIDFLVGS